MSTKTLTAIFDSAGDAQRAHESLVSLGLAAHDVRVINQGEDSAQAGDDGKGFWESIKDFFVADEDRATYAEGVRRGGYLLTVKVEDEYAGAAGEILETCNAVDLDERAEQWRSEGWTDTPAAAPTNVDESDTALDESAPADDSEEIIRTEVDVEDSRDDADDDDAMAPPPDLQERSRRPGEKPTAR